MRSRVARCSSATRSCSRSLGLVWFVHGLPTLTEECRSGCRSRRRRLHRSSSSVLDEMAGQLAHDARRRDRRRPLSELRAARARGHVVSERDDGARMDVRCRAVDIERTDRERTRRPHLKNHPDNLFTLLGGSYSLRVHETTRDCVREASARGRSGRASARATGSSRTASTCSYRGSSPSRCPST